MASSKVQIARGSQRKHEPQVLSAGLPSEPGDAAQPLAPPAQERHMEQMYQLADIFASIFEALHDAPDAAIATTREGDLTSHHENSLH